MGRNIDTLKDLGESVNQFPSGNAAAHLSIPAEYIAIPLEAISFFTVELHLFALVDPKLPLPQIITGFTEGDVLESNMNTNPALQALNDELYDFLALSVRGFIFPWWMKISPRDREFPQEVTQIITHVLRQVEDRVMVADVPLLLANVLPTLLKQHYADYHTASAKVATSYVTGLPSDNDPLAHIFHSLQPHMAISAEGKIDPNYIRQAVEHVMKACLPPEDWESENERSIVREIIVKIILENAFPRLSQGWFIQKNLLELLGSPNDFVAPSTFNLVVVFVLSAVQSISGFALAAISGVQACLQTIADVNKAPPRKYRTDPTRRDLATPSVEMLAEKVLFPNGFPGPPPVEPNMEEQMLIREQLERRLFDVIPSMIGKLIYGPNLDVQRRTVKDILDPLSSSKCNLHLLMFILDAIIVTVFPELALNAPDSEISKNGALGSEPDSPTQTPQLHEYPRETSVSPLIGGEVLSNNVCQGMLSSTDSQPKDSGAGYMVRWIIMNECEFVRTGYELSDKAGYGVQGCKCQRGNADSDEEMPYEKK
ncbi:9354_t:CDS:2, partial [Acaulospora colombiana]